MTSKIDFTLRDVMAATGGVFTGDCRLLDEKITSLCIDSRRAEPGSVFVAIKGEKTDGYNYISGAIEKGALCALSDRPCETNHLNRFHHLHQYHHHIKC